jgi:tyramine---L-glutamate ligase
MTGITRMGDGSQLKTVLIYEYVTGGGLAGEAWPASWATEGGAMRRALAADFSQVPGVRVVMMLDERLRDEPELGTTVRIQRGAERAMLERLAAEVEYTALIAPETGGILSERARWIEAAGGRSLGASPAAIDLAGNKLRLARHLTAHGVATPPVRSILPLDGLPEAFDYPAVLKPIDGAGAIDTFFVPSPATVPPEARTQSLALLQPFIVGEPMSASFLVSASDRPFLIGVGRQRVERRGGRFVYLGGTLPAAFPGSLDPVQRAVASVPGLRGFVGVDFVWDELSGRLSVLEINPRLTTSFVGLRHVLPQGRLSRAWLAALEGTDDDLANLACQVQEAPPVTFSSDGVASSR